MPKSLSQSEIKKTLDRAFKSFHRREFIKTDPISLIPDFQSSTEHELACLLASAMAYGNVKAMMPKISQLFTLLGPQPIESIYKTAKLEIIEQEWGSYRFYRSKDARWILEALSVFLEKHQSLGQFFKNEYSQNQSLFDCISIFRAELHRCAHSKAKQSYGFQYWIPDGRSGAAKRMHLFFRWLVRKDEIDFGLWDFIPKSALMIPLDTHLHQQALRLGLTSRKTTDRKTVEEITSVLQLFDPADPIKYDFALYHIGKTKRQA